MTFPLISLQDLVTILIISVGAAFVVTGSTLGYPIRWLAYKMFGWIGHEPIWLDSLARCPYCHAWWEGLGWAYFTGHSLPQCLQAAFAACGIAAIVQAQWSLAAGREKYQREG